jgi:hypothetical protein
VWRTRAAASVTVRSVVGTTRLDDSSARTARGRLFATRSCKVDVCVRGRNEDVQNTCSGKSVASVIVNRTCHRVRLVL